MKKTLQVLLTALIVGCSADISPPLIVGDVIVTPPRAGTAMRAGYLTITNNGHDRIVLTSVTSPQFGRVEMHETIIDNDIARMRPIAELAIDAGASVAFEQGGKHLMLMQPQVEAGTITLNFYAGEQLLLSVNATDGGN